MRADIFCAQERIILHEEARNDGKISFFDTMKEARQVFLIFISHQWLGWDDPDPKNEQFAMMVAGVKRLAYDSQKRLAETYIWLDAFSIPQRNKFSQRAGIQSLPVYVSIAKRFLIVAVQSSHRDTSQACDLESYMSRCWARMEQLSFMLKKGYDHMYIQSDCTGFCKMKEYHKRDGGANLMATGQAELEANIAALFVVEGDLTCCTLKHPNGCMCDLERLVEPFVALYASMLCSVKNGRDRGKLAPMMLEIERHKSRIFPTTFQYLTVVDGVEQWREKSLFGKIIETAEAMCAANPKIAFVKSSQQEEIFGQAITERVHGCTQSDGDEHMTYMDTAGSAFTARLAGASGSSQTLAEIQEECSTRFSWDDSPLEL
eukprot:TRINITY_DN87889_c0_g1_i1.p1 TRINITY_DN87889_c0_g1~~TRINITY_DN87889_c0_g1_i1.p1  ORF type:complete len:434 (-),score=82.71 TRINITY_DN87889_c0_g1_i1:123-1247(-)